MNNAFKKIKIPCINIEILFVSLPLSLSSLFKSVLGRNGRTCRRRGLICYRETRSESIRNSSVDFRSEVNGVKQIFRPASEKLIFRSAILFLRNSINRLPAPFSSVEDVVERFN